MTNQDICPECAAELVNFHDVIEAVEDAIKSAPKEKREALAVAIDRYTDFFMDEYAWAIGPQSPSFLSGLLMAVDCASKPHDDEVTDLDDGSTPTAEPQFIGEDEANDPDAVEREARKLN